MLQGLITVPQIFNFVIQRDNQLTMQIAEQSRRDNLINIEIAKINVKIAEETHKDGSAMKTIAILTLIFLPGTAIAVRTILYLRNQRPR